MSCFIKLWTATYWPEPKHLIKQNVVYTFSSCMWIPVYSQQLTMFVWILNVICVVVVVVVGCFAVAGSVCRFISSFYLKAPNFLKHYNFTSIFDDSSLLFFLLLHQYLWIIAVRICTLLLLACCCVFFILHEYFIVCVTRFEGTRSSAGLQIQRTHSNE